MKSRAELTKIAESLGMTPMGAALDRLLVSGAWLFPPAPERIGRRRSRPGAAYAALVRRGLAETDGNGRYRVLCAEDGR